MKKYACLWISILLLLALSGCRTDRDQALQVLDKDHAAAVKHDIEVFSEGDISEITACVFGEAFDEGTAGGSGSGIVADLFANAQVEITAADETAISYTIVSPDISGFFTENADQLDSITTSEELGRAILEYANSVSVKEYTVTVPYVVEEGKIDVAYDDPDFINAMTGGLLEAYADLYNQYLEEMG